MGNPTVKCANSMEPTIGAQNANNGCAIGAINRILIYPHAKITEQSRYIKRLGKSNHNLQMTQTPFRLKFNISPQLQRILEKR